ncbi:MAG: hypothetical protein V1676_02495 [Candidatus Diapherotrites archaeon]
MVQMNDILQKMKKAGRAAFRTREYAAMLGKKGYARLALHRLNVRGEIVPVKNGWWAFPDAIPEAAACEISKPCYVSFHSALFLHGLTTQAPRNIQLAVTRKTKKYRIFGMEAKEYKIKKGQFAGFLRKDGILLAQPEKAFADSIMLPRTCPDIVLTEAAKKIDIAQAKGFLEGAAAEKRLRRVLKHAKQE